jgi:HPt (histidine-containing phosphotransfer) domain-containing protein
VDETKTRVIVANEIIDEAELMDRLEGDEELLRGLIDTFLEEASPLLQQVLEAVTRRDAAGLNRAAHKLKGMVSIFGSGEAAQAAEALETMGREEDLNRAEDASAHLRERMEALEKSLARLKEKHVQSSDRG